MFLNDPRDLIKEAAEKDQIQLVRTDYLLNLPNESSRIQEKDETDTNLQIASDQGILSNREP